MSRPEPLAVPIHCPHCRVDGVITVGGGVTPSPGFVLSAMRTVRHEACGRVAATR